MRAVRPLLPYALVSAAIVVASVVALASTALGPSFGAPAPSGSPVATGLAHLSDTARLAYWRHGASGAWELWLGDLDDRLRWRALVESANEEISLTRWSPDGDAVAFVVNGQGLVVVRVDGRVARLGRPADLATPDWRLVSFEWSLDGARLAGTWRAGNGFSNESDVYLVEARHLAPWSRLTTMGDAFAGRWIDGDRLFVETASGLIAVMSASTRAMRPLTGMVATSALVGRDGRVHFVSGGTLQSTSSSQPYAGDRVFSVTTDGDDLRQETSEPIAQMRLQGLLADGRAVAGVPGGMYFVGSAKSVLAFTVGTIRRVAVSGDGRRVVGFTESRVLLLDPAKVAVPAPALPPADATTVLLSGVGDGDAWFPRVPATLSHAAPHPSGGPRARLVFPMGGILWEADPDGTVTVLASLPEIFIARARWSPSGDRVAAYVTWRTHQGSSVVVAGSGPLVRWDVPTYAQGLFWWDDHTLALWSGGQLVDRGRGPRQDPWSTDLYDAATGTATGHLAGRRLRTPAGTLVLTDGEPSLYGSIWQAIEIEDAAGRRPLTDAHRLLAEPILGVAGAVEAAPSIYDPEPSGDGAYLGLTFSLRTGLTIARTIFVIVRMSDGGAVFARPLYGDGDTYVAQASMSPSGHLVAWTETMRASSDAVTARVVDPSTGRTVIAADGRFAGWGPDGAWIYVARNEGLFAYPIAGGDAVRVGPFGVEVVAAKP